MAEISLRTYLEDLDSLLENEALEEVIGHCKHIMQTFPKNLATYRILGKALLEQGKHQDAADVFQRVLSADPSDFISHAGMSMVYEEQDQIDQAIWHMESAFEQEPGNQAIRGQMRRLYGRRDGFEPPKFQLTPGALARQYARGQLYTQAVGELHQALAEQPERLDLQAPLCECLWRAGEKRKAGEVAVQILDKLPYCLVANRVLGELWLGYGRLREAEPFLARIEELDPYLVLELGADGGQVDREAVQLTRLEWTGAVDGRPEWVAALDDAFPGGGEVAPDWARDLADETPAKMTVEEALAFDMSDLGQPEAGEEMPDWMAELQAETAAGPDESRPFEVVGGDEDWSQELGGLVEESLPETDAASLGRMPEIAPEPPPEPPMPIRTPTGLTGELGPVADRETPAWLRDMIGGTAKTVAPEQPAAEAGEEISEAVEPGWLTGGDFGASATEVAAPAPDWLVDSGADFPAPTEEETMPEGEADWLADLMEGSIPDAEAESAGGAEEELAAEVDAEWLSNIVGATTPPPEEAAAPGEMPDWLVSAQPTGEAAPSAAETGLDWLVGATEAAPAPEETAALEEMPDWLVSAQPTEEAAPPAEEAGLDWLVGATEAAPAPEEAAAPEEIPDWLASAQPTEEATESLLEEGFLAEFVAPPIEEEPARPAEAVAQIGLLGAFEAPAEDGTVVEGAEKTEEPSALRQAPSAPIWTPAEQLAEPPPIATAGPPALERLEGPPPEVAGPAEVTAAISDTPAGRQRPEPGEHRLFPATAEPVAAAPEWLREVTEAPEDWEASSEEPQKG
jgi:tetratricopeptide (TPR) repeat protein